MLARRPIHTSEPMQWPSTAVVESGTEQTVSSRILRNERGGRFGHPLPLVLDVSSMKPNGRSPASRTMPPEKTHRGRSRRRKENDQPNISASSVSMADTANSTFSARSFYSNTWQPHSIRPVSSLLLLLHIFQSYPGSLHHYHPLLLLYLLPSTPVSQQNQPHPEPLL
jgi:hypothetical protein